MLSSSLRCTQSHSSLHSGFDRTTALARELSHRILEAPIAADALQLWCDEQGLPPGRMIYRRRVRSRTRFADDDALDLLTLRRHESVETRCTTLLYGDAVIAEADHWVVPSRLPAHVRIAVKASNIALDAAFRTIGASREILGVRLGGSLEDAAVVLEHRALYRDEDNRPLAVVTQSYFTALLRR